MIDVLVFENSKKLYHIMFCKCFDPLFQRLRQSTIKLWHRFSPTTICNLGTLLEGKNFFRIEGKFLQVFKEIYSWPKFSKR